jgi:hypothetical protein
VHEAAPISDRKPKLPNYPITLDKLLSALPLRA